MIVEFLKILNSYGEKSLFNVIVVHQVYVQSQVQASQN